MESEGDKHTSINDSYAVDKCIEWIQEHNFNKVCLQFPDSLLPDSVEVALLIEKCINQKVYILGDTSYGSCCVDEVAAQHINADSIIHFGHACLSPTARLPVFHVFPKRNINVPSFIEEFQTIFKDKDSKVLFFYAVEYAYEIEHIRQCLNTIYKNLIFSTLNCTSNVNFVDNKDDSSNTTLGRSYELENDCKIEDYEAFYLGEDGKTFTAFSISIPAKRWYYYENERIIPTEAMKTPWLKRRRYLVEKLKDAKVVGIVVATLGIKKYLEAITMVKSILKKRNIKSYILSVGKVNPPKLANFPEIEAFVLITCPENEVFDSRDFLRPILLPYEVELAFNSARTEFNQYSMDFTQILPGGDNYKEFDGSEDSSVSLITGALRSSDSDVICTEKMTTLAIKTPGIVAIGKAGAQFLQDRSWKGVEQRLGKDAVESAVIGRTGLPINYQNEPVPTEIQKTDT